MQSQTSRNAALDYLLAIGNLIALADHKEEQVMNLMEEHESSITLPDITQDELHTLQESIRLEIVQTTKERDELYRLRKDLQRNFFERYNIDQDYRCQFKHYAVALTAAEECRNADPTFQNDTLVTQLRKQVYQFLGQAMGVGPANCGRCLADAWDNRNKPAPKNVLPELPDNFKGPFKCKHDDGLWRIREYKVRDIKADPLGDRETIFHLKGEGDGEYYICAKDFTPEQLQIPLHECEEIKAETLYPTPIDYKREDHLPA